MSGSWWTKTVLFAVAAVGSILLLIPTYYQTVHEDMVPPDDESVWPGWYSTLYNAIGRRHITWGLDLQGGLHLQYQVDVDRAISDKVDRFVDQIRDQVDERIEEDDLGVTATVERITGQPALRITVDGDVRPLDLVDEDELALMNLSVVTEATGALRLEVDSAFIEETKDYAISQAIETIRSRIDATGVAEPSISRRGDTDIIVQLPGLSEEQFEQAKNIISRTAVLRFQMVSDQSNSFLASVNLPEIEGVTNPAGSLPTAGPEPENLEALRTAFEDVTTPAGTVVAFERIEQTNPQTQEMELTGYRPMLLEAQADLTGEYVADARVATDPQTAKPVVSMQFDVTGASLFCTLTTENSGRRMAIVLDDEVRSAPNINEPICGGRAQITMGSGGSYNQMYLEAEALTIVLRNGALPAPIEKQFETQVGPSLGADSIRSGALSLAIAFGLVVCFVLFYYKAAGFITNLALFTNVLFIGAMLSLLGATLTLPGIAGITLTIGMAVDANVIIFERIKEERRLGKTLRAAIASGYEKALSAVVDANVTTAVAGIILLEFGSGPVRGFAVTLLIGIASSLLTAVVLTRLVFDYLLDGRKVTRLSM